ncbi:MAG: four helix bundle protein [Chloroflexota bacterium]
MAEWQGGRGVCERVKELLIVNYGEWIEKVPQSIKSDPLWEIEVYRKALFLSDLAWRDCDGMLKHDLGRPLAQQLIRSSGSISANMEEGFGRGFGKDYARFLRIALGSARETRGWYYRSRHLLKPGVLEHRLDLPKTIIAGLITMSNQQTKR